MILVVDERISVSTVVRVLRFRKEKLPQDMKGKIKIKLSRYRPEQAPGVPKG
jgi:hypothetical protein